MLCFQRNTFAECGFLMVFVNPIPVIFLKEAGGYKRLLGYTILS